MLLDMRVSIFCSGSSCELCHPPAQCAPSLANRAPMMGTGLTGRWHPHHQGGHKLWHPGCLQLRHGLLQGRRRHWLGQLPFLIQLLEVVVNDSECKATQTAPQPMRVPGASAAYYPRILQISGYSVSALYHAQGPDRPCCPIPSQHPSGQPLTCAPCRWSPSALASGYCPYTSLSQRPTS